MFFKSSFFILEEMLLDCDQNTGFLNPEWTSELITCQLQDKVTNTFMPSSYNFLIFWQMLLNCWNKIEEYLLSFLVSLSVFSAHN